MSKERVKTIHLFVGLPGSGKTTFYERNKALFFRGAVRLSLDDFRRLIGGHQFYPNFEPIVKMWVDVTGKYMLANGYDLVLDATHISAHLRRSWINIARMFGYVVRCWHFQTPKRRCIDRDHDRIGTKNAVGLQIIENMASRFERPLKAEGFEAVIRVDERGRVKTPKARKT